MDHPLSTREKYFFLTVRINLDDVCLKTKKYWHKPHKMNETKKKNFLANPPISPDKCIFFFKLGFKSRFTKGPSSSFINFTILIKATLSKT